MTEPVAPPRRHKAAIRAENERVILRAAETIFAERGFEGATIGEIACLAGVPKANLHYYFPTKKDLYRRVLDDVVSNWLDAAGTFETCEDDPAEALGRYIRAKMEMSRRRPLGSKVWANEIIHGARVIGDYLETTLKDWLASRETCIRRWIAEGKIRDIEPKALFYMIWAVTQHYADFSRQIEILNDGKPLSDEQFERATEEVTAIILRGIGAID